MILEYILFSIGGLLVGIPIFKMIRLSQKIKKGIYVTTEGNVVDHRENRDRHGITFSPIYEFYVNGKAYRVVSNTYSNIKFKRPKKIAYNPNKPTESTIVGDSIIVIIFGIIFLIAGVIVYIY